MEHFEPGDVVAVLSNGTVTKDTTLDNVQFVSVVPGDPGDSISPWKILPDPPPDNIEEYQLVVMLGIAKVNISSFQPYAFDSCLVIPSGISDGNGVIIKKDDIAEEDNRFSQVIGLPIGEISTLVAPSDDSECRQILIVRNSQIYQPVITQLLSTICTIKKNSEQHSKQIEKLTRQIEELKTSPITRPNETELLQIVEICPSIIVALAQKSNDKKCSLLHEAAEDEPKLWSILATKQGKAIVSAPGKPHEIMVVANETNSPEKLNNILVVDIIAKNNEKRSFAFQRRACWLPSDADSLCRGNYSYCLNGPICEFAVNGRFCLRFMVVTRKPNISDVNLFRRLFTYSQRVSTRITAPSSSQLKRILRDWKRVKKDIPSDSEVDIHSLIEQSRWLKFSTHILTQPPPFQLSKEELVFTCSKLKEHVESMIKSDKENLLMHGIRATFLPDFSKLSTEQQVSAWARYVIALEPLKETREKSIPQYYLESVCAVADGSPLFCWKWCSAANIDALSYELGWDGNTQKDFPHTKNAMLAFNIFFHLLQFGPVLRKFGQRIAIPLATAAKLISDKRTAQETLLQAYKVLQLCSKDLFLRGILLKYKQVLSFFSVKYKPPFADVQPIVTDIKQQLYHRSFAGVVVDSDVSASIPFIANIPAPDPSYMDKLKNLLFILTFREHSLYATSDYIQFWVKFPLQVPIESLKTPLKKVFLHMEYLDTHECESSPWRVAFIYNGNVYKTIQEKPVRKNQLKHWWISTVSLQSFVTSKGEKSVWLKDDVPSDGLVIKFRAHREQLPADFTIGLGSLHIK